MRKPGDIVFSRVIATGDYTIIRVTPHGTIIVGEIKKMSDKSGVQKWDVKIGRATISKYNFEQAKRSAKIMLRMKVM